MKRIISGMALIVVLSIASPAMANNGNPQNCEANPQQPFCGDTISVEQPTAQECPAGGFVFVLNSVRYPICNGTDGTNGTNGADGANGSNGSPGPAGASGSDGATGGSGSAGTAGLPGAQGVAGVPGTTQVVKVKSRKWTCVRREHRVNGHRRLVVACKKKHSKLKPYVITSPR